MRHLCAIFALLSLSACGPSGTATAPPERKPVASPKISDQTRNFPLQDRGSVTIVEDHIEGKAFLPGGNVAAYGSGKGAFKAFLIQTDSPTKAAILLSDVRKNLTDAKLVPSFGGYFGTDSGVAYFVFPKGKWLAGVIGLPQDKADAFARQFAARIN